MRAVYGRTAPVSRAVPRPATWTRREERGRDRAVHRARAPAAGPRSRSTRPRSSSPSTRTPISTSPDRSRELDQLADAVPGATARRRCRRAVRRGRARRQHGRLRRPAQLVPRRRARPPPRHPDLAVGRHDRGRPPRRRRPRRRGHARALPRAAAPASSTCGSTRSTAGGVSTKPAAASCTSRCGSNRRSRVDLLRAGRHARASSAGCWQTSSRRSCGATRRRSRGQRGCGCGSPSCSRASGASSRGCSGASAVSCEAADELEAVATELEGDDAEQVTRDATALRSRAN